MFLEESGGARIIGVSDSGGAIFNERGLPVRKLKEYFDDNGHLSGFPDARNLHHRDDVLELDCDILVPAAVQNTITTRNEPRVRARIVAEGANGPVTAEAARRLFERGVLVIPGTYLNAGGVTVSYFEWLKNLSHVRFGRLEKRFQEHSHRRLLSAIGAGDQLTDDEVDVLVRGPGEQDLVRSGLEETMVRAYHAIRTVQRQFGEDQPIDLGTAALVLATNKIAISYERRGIFP